MLIVAFACFTVLVVAWLIAAESVPEAAPAAPAAVTVEPAGAAATLVDARSGPAS